MTSCTGSQQCCSRVASVQLAADAAALHFLQPRFDLTELAHQSCHPVLQPGCFLYLPLGRCLLRKSTWDPTPDPSFFHVFPEQTWANYFGNTGNDDEWRLGRWPRWEAKALDFFRRKHVGDNAIAAHLAPFGHKESRSLKSGAGLYGFVDFV